MTSFLYRPPTADRRLKTMVGRSTNRRADSAIEHMARGGVPVNPGVLKLVRESIESGAWRQNPEQLYEAIKSDPGLFIHIAKHMRSLADDVREGIDPLAQLAKLEDEKLLRLFSGHDRDISVHRLRDATPAQALRFQHAVISARAAEALAPKVDVSANLAYSGAVLRQMGHEMLSWNYPDIYARALLHQRTKGANLDQELQRLIGMTPAQVGSRFAADWNLSPELRWAVQSDGQRQPSIRQEPEEQADGRLTLRDVCDLSELFAKANDPVHYPDAPEKWSEAEHMIESTTGIHLPEVVAGVVQKSLALLGQITQHVVHTPFFKPPEAPSALVPEQRKMLEANAYLRRCPAEVRRVFESVYARIVPEQISVEAVRELVDRIIPQLGFIRGCVYLVKGEGDVLKPALRVGDLPLTSYRALRDDEQHPVSESLHSLVLLKSSFGPINASPGSHLYAALPSKKHQGVLHLEVAPEKVEDPGHDSSLLFNAVRQALVDCFGG